MGACPLFQCSLCLQGLGPFGGPGARWEDELWSPVSLGSMGKHPRSTYITWSIAEVLGLVWLCLNGYVSFVSMLFLLARAGALWWPLCSSAYKGWGLLVAPEHCRGAWTCLAESQGVCVLCFSAHCACKGWGHVVAPVRPGRLNSGAL